MPDLVFHIGYPKTGTTTLQASFFPCHNEIDYQGKLIPSHQYHDADLFQLFTLLQTAPSVELTTLDTIRDRIETIVAKSNRKIVLFSSENFLHPETSDIGLVAERLWNAFPKARIMIMLREQVDMLYSFYRNHGAFGQYLFTMKELDAPLLVPIPLEEWLQYQFLTPFKNVLGTLNYGAVVDRYSQLFGRANVHVGLFEEFRANPRQFLGHLCDFLGIQRDWNLIESLKPSNASFDSVTFEQVARKAFAGSQPNQRPARPDFQLAESVPEPWRAQILDRFRNSNRRVADLTHLNLAHYGYSS